MVLSRVDLPTEGKPIMATRASPDLSTSNPSPFSPFFPVGSSSCDLYLANLALRVPRWYSVALFFCVRAISFSISLIFSRMPMVINRERHGREEGQQKTGPTAAGTTSTTALTAGRGRPGRQGKAEKAAEKLKCEKHQLIPCHMKKKAKVQVGGLAA